MICRYLSLLAISARAADEVVRLHALFDRAWETQLRENPLFATSVGRHEYDDRWDLRGAVDDVRLLFYVGLQVAEQPELPRWSPGDEFEPARKDGQAVSVLVNVEVNFRLY